MAHLAQNYLATLEIKDTLKLISASTEYRVPETAKVCRVFIFSMLCSHASGCVANIPGLRCDLDIVPMLQWIQEETRHRLGVGALLSECSRL